MPPPFNPSKAGPGGSRGLVRRTQSWYAPEPDAWTPTPPFAITTATVAQQPIQQPDLSEQRAWAWRWYAPDEDAHPELPPTRLYPRSLLNYAAGDPSNHPRFPPHSGTWDIGTDTWRWMLTTRPASASNNLFGDLATAPNQNVFILTFVSPPLDGPQRIEGWVRAILQGRESAVGDDARAQLLVRLVSGDGATVRGTLLDFDNAALSNEFSLSPAESRRFPVNWNNSIMSPLDAQDGDRIVVEAGFRAFATSSGTVSIGVVQHATDDKDGSEGDTSTAKNTWVQFSKAYKFRGEPDLSSWTIEQPAYWLPQRWFTPEPEAFVAVTAPAAFDPGTGFDWSEEPADWRVSFWFQPDTETWTSIPLPNAYSGFDLQEQPADWRLTRWFAPEADAWTPIPLDAAYSGFGLQEQPADWVITRWFAPDAETWTAVPNLTVAAVEQQPIQQPDESEQRDQTLFWFTTDDAFEGLVPPGFVPPFNPATDQPLQDQPADWRPVIWFAPEASVEGPDPTGYAPPFDASKFDWQDQPADWRLTFWFAPEADTWTAIPLDNAYSGFDLQEQPADWRLTRWFQPDTETWTAIPNLTVAAIDQFPIQQPDASEQRGNGQRWFTPDDAYENPAPAALYGIPADQLAGLWQDGSGQQDRSIQPTWQAPDAEHATLTGLPSFIDTTAFSATLQEQPGQERSLVVIWFTTDDDYMGWVPFGITTATVAQQAALWQEQPGQERSLTVRWFNPDAEISPPSAWLLGVPPSTVPAVLFDVETGDAFLHLDGPFIIRAS